MAPTAAGAPARDRPVLPALGRDSRPRLMLRVPEYLQVSTVGNAAERAAWLSALPDRIDDVSARWGLQLSDPFEPGGNSSWVAPGTDAGGRDIVLKVAWRHTEALHEAEGLAVLGGNGAVEVQAF